MQEFNIGRVCASPRKWIPWYVIWAHAGVLHLELCVESKRAQDQIDDTLWHNFIYQVCFCPPYSCTIRYFSMSTNCSTWCRSLLLSFSTCYLGILGIEEAINCILAWTSHQRTSSEKRTKALLPKCPLFGGSTVSASRRSSVIRWMVLLVQVSICTPALTHVQQKQPHAVIQTTPCAQWERRLHTLTAESKD